MDVCCRGSKARKPDTHTHQELFVRGEKGRGGRKGAGLSGQQEPWEAVQLAARTMENPAQQKHPAEVREWLWGWEGEEGGSKQRARSAVWTCLHITTQPHPGLPPQPPPSPNPAGAAEGSERSAAPAAPEVTDGSAVPAGRAFAHRGCGGGGGGALGPAGRHPAPALRHKQVGRVASHGSGVFPTAPAQEQERRRQPLACVST